jgi:hypothetical protein
MKMKLAAIHSFRLPAVFCADARNRSRATADQVDLDGVYTQVQAVPRHGASNAQEVRVSCHGAS